MSRLELGAVAGKLVLLLIALAPGDDSARDSGQLVSVERHKVTVTSSDGLARDYTVAGRCRVTLDARPVQLRELHAGDQLTIGIDRPTGFVMRIDAVSRTARR